MHSNLQFFFSFISSKWSKCHSVCIFVDREQLPVKGLISYVHSDSTELVIQDSFLLNRVLYVAGALLPGSAYSGCHIIVEKLSFD